MNAREHRKAALSVISGFGGVHVLIPLLYYAVIAAALFGILYLAVRLAVTHVLRKHGVIPPRAGNDGSPPLDHPPVD